MQEVLEMFVSMMRAELQRNAVALVAFFVIAAVSAYLWGRSVFKLSFASFMLACATIGFVAITVYRGYWLSHVGTLFVFIVIAIILGLAAGAIARDLRGR